MSKVLIIDVANKEYKFGLDRKEIVRAEKIGFRIREIESSPVTQISMFWKVGLHKHQPNLNDMQCDDLMDKYIEEGGDVNEVIEFLSQEYVAFLQTTQADTKKKKARVEEI